MKRFLSLMLTAIVFCGVLCLPRTAYARDELKNEDPDRFYVLLDLNNQIVFVYERDANGEYTKLVRCFLCTTGRTEVDETDPEDVATPTPRGVWKIGGRERFGKFANFANEYARYWVQIVGSIFFHSIMFGNRTVNSMKSGAYAKLGQNVSHGCVRLYVEDARWLYYYACPGTTIEVSTSQPKNGKLKKALKSKLSFRAYNAFQKTITDDPELPNDKAWVTVENARLKKGSGDTFDTVARLALDTELEVLMQGETWVKVRYGKREGYVKRGYITYSQGQMDTKEDADLLRTTQWIYVEPSEKSEQICKVPEDTSVKVLERTEDGWAKIAYRNEVGYLKSARLYQGWGEIMG